MAVEAAIDTARAVSVTLTAPPEVVAIVGALVPLALRVIAPVPLLSCNVPEVRTEPADWEIVPVPVAVRVMLVAVPIPAARAMLPLEPPPVFCRTTAPVAFSKPFTVIIGEATLLSVSVNPAAVENKIDTAAAVSVTLTVPPEVVAIAGALVPVVLRVITPVPLLSCNVPEVTTDPADWVMVPVPLAVSVTLVAPPPEPILLARAMLPLPAVFCSTTAPVAFNKPLTVIVGAAALMSVRV